MYVKYFKTIIFFLCLLCPSLGLGRRRHFLTLSVCACMPCRGILPPPPLGVACQRLVIGIFKHTHTHPFNGPFSGTTQVSRYQKGKTNLDFTEARDSEWQWHQLGRMQVCTSLQTDNHASTPPLSFLQARCPSCRPTNNIKALKEQVFLNSNT